MADAVSTEIKKELTKDEPLLWSGQPQQGLVLRDSDVISIPLSVVIAGVIAWLVNGPLKETGTPLLMFIAIAAGCIGFYMVVGRFFHDALLRQYTVYALTDQRILILTTLIIRNVNSISLRTLNEIDIKLHGNRGCIAIGPSMSGFRLFGRLDWDNLGRNRQTMFERITNPREVYEQIKQTQNDALKNSPHR